MEKYKSKITIDKSLFTPRESDKISASTKNQLDNIKKDKLKALESLMPKIYDMISEMIVKSSSNNNENFSDPELLLKTIKNYYEINNEYPKLSDCVEKLGWGWKRFNESLDKLIDSNQVQKIKDKNDGRIKRLKIK